MMLREAGKDPAKATEDDVMATLDVVDKYNKAGQIRRFTGNDYTKDLAAGNVWACVAYSGDIVQLQADNPKLQFAIPEAGGAAWSDNMMIPQKAKTPYGAETWMNYVYDPTVAAKLADYVNYFSPVKGAKEVLLKTDPDIANNQLIFPDEATLKRLYPYPSLPQPQERAITERMQTVMGQ